MNDLKIVINDVLGKYSEIYEEVLLFYLPCLHNFQMQINI